MAKLTAKIAFEMGWRASNAGLPRNLIGVEEFLQMYRATPLSDIKGNAKIGRLCKQWYRGYDSSTLMATRPFTSWFVKQSLGVN